MGHDLPERIRSQDKVQELRSGYKRRGKILKFAGVARLYSFWVIWRLNGNFKGNSLINKTSNKKMHKGNGFENLAGNGLWGILHVVYRLGFLWIIGWRV